MTLSPTWVRNGEARTVSMTDVGRDLDRELEAILMVADEPQSLAALLGRLIGSGPMNGLRIVHD